ncbi:helix-turn-helix domain-containing protein [Modestobacter sp. SYSU DS0290]
MTEGLRERGKERRRRAIQAAAFDLFAEQGYRATTMAEIARRADVAERTVALHFGSKPDLALSLVAEYSSRLGRALHDRPDGVRVLDLVLGSLADVTGPDGQDDVREASRRAFVADPDLRALRWARADAQTADLAAAFAAETGLPADAVPGRLVAAAVTAVLIELADVPAGPAREVASTQAAGVIRAIAATLG